MSEHDENRDEGELAFSDWYPRLGERGFAIGFEILDHVELESDSGAEDAPVRRFRVRVEPTDKEWPEDPR